MALYVLFDTETTGNQEQDRIIQVGAMIVHSKEKIEIYDELCSSEVPISLEAMEVHNITPEIIEGKAPFSETMFAAKVNELNSAENFLIAHNINFDLDMLKKEGFENAYTLIDTFRCAKHLYPEMPYHRLQYLRYALGLYKTEEEEADNLGITIKAHDAIGDVLVMKLLLSQLVQSASAQFEGKNPMQVLAELTQTPVLMRTFKFGKYKGREIAEVANEDMGYLQWMRKNLELDEDMAFTLDSYLN
ncbi:exonuclease domain-containing protein [Sulfurovum sp.]|jgi:DNA polymerase III alpha subunit (gram-positive type)|uniref:exonuclease domain-containing protein n=1 Tax=Sulfurovum sp. TaxID=1969726 RepID=UPI002A3700E5|nr:exonuclease domain-containing protein [Sulfurovum sp.]MDD2451316.1 exonuclease domain-containing protein [Sulfurovum sp.]MDD3499391.1 exonuclease domain-containing protein [Sulfurovum sp.]MDY0402345.1 exonuclease domain-containing protein [Sulfurovum sp.]